MSGPQHIVRSPVITAQPAGGSAWRGLFLHRTDFSQTIPGTDAVQFDLAIDTDGIASTDYTQPDGVTLVYPGSAGVVPVGMAGLWRVSGRANFSIVAGVSFAVYYLGVGILTNGQIPEVMDPNTAYGREDRYITEYETYVAYITGVALPPAIFNLAEGDIVWMRVDTGVNYELAVDDGSGAAYMLMEYLGPAPA